MDGVRRDEHDADLLKAVKEGDLDAVVQAVQAGARVDARDSDGRTALYHALWYADRIHLARWLFDHGADINVANRGGTALPGVAGHRFLSEILERPGVVLDDAIAVRVLRSNHGDPRVRKVLEQKGADVSAWEDTFRQLALRVMNCVEPDAYEHLLKPAIDTLGPKLEALSHLRAWNRSATYDEVQMDLIGLYALSRVHDILVCGFVPTRCEPANQYFDSTWPTVTIEEYEAFFRGLGFETHRPEPFHPIFHEIVKVTQAADPDSPPRVLEFLWPVVMFGQMVFARAGVHISAGENHIVGPIAESSSLHFTYARANRQTDDLSHGSGSSSQWNTDLRRDYVDDDGFHYNVDGKVDLTDPTAFSIWEDERIYMSGPRYPKAYWIEFLTHRCRISYDEDDEWPYDLRLSLPN